MRTSTLQKSRGWATTWRITGIVALVIFFACFIKGDHAAAGWFILLSLVADHRADHAAAGDEKKP